MFNQPFVWNMKVFKESKYMCNGFWLAVTMYDMTIHRKQHTICYSTVFMKVKVLEKPRILTQCITCQWTWLQWPFPNVYF